MNGFPERPGNQSIVLIKNAVHLIGIESKSKIPDLKNKSTGQGAATPYPARSRMSRHSTPVNIISSQEKLRAEIHSDFPDLERLKRSEKRMFLEKHRDMILQYLEVFGTDKTLLEFHMRKETLWQLQEGYRTTPYRKMTKREETELRYKLAIEKVAELEKKLEYLTIRFESLLEVRKETRELRESFEEFSENTASQVARTLIEPLIKSLVSQYGGIMPTDSGMLGPAVNNGGNVVPGKRCLKTASKW